MQQQHRLDNVRISEGKIVKLSVPFECIAILFIDCADDVVERNPFFGKETTAGVDCDTEQ